MVSLAARLRERFLQSVCRVAVHGRGGHGSPCVASLAHGRAILGFLNKLFEVALPPLARGARARARSWPPFAGSLWFASSAGDYSSR
jgi:hypothetical protein